MNSYICDSCGKDYSKELFVNISDFKIGYKTYRFCTRCTKKIADEMINKELK